jgi:hypothetical protein
MLSTICDVLNWHRLASAEDGRSRVFARALGETEKGYYWDRCAPAFEITSAFLSPIRVQPFAGRVRHHEPLHHPTYLRPLDRFIQIRLT